MELVTRDGVVIPREIITPEGRCIVCHRPPGNTENEHTIQVGCPSISAHLRHGVTLGECEGNNAP